MEIAFAFRVDPSDDAERPGAYAAFPYDRDLVRRFRERFPRARWRGAEQRWFVRGTTAVQRLDAWMAQELETLDRHADAKGRDAYTFDPLESPYLTVADDLKVRTPYSRTVVEALRPDPLGPLGSRGEDLARAVPLLRGAEGALARDRGGGSSATSPRPGRDGVKNARRPCFRGDQAGSRPSAAAGAIRCRATTFRRLASRWRPTDGASWSSRRSRATSSTIRDSWRGLPADRDGSVPLRLGAMADAGTAGDLPDPARPQRRRSGSQVRPGLVVAKPGGIAGESAQAARDRAGAALAASGTQGLCRSMRIDRSRHKKSGHEARIFGWLILFKTGCRRRNRRGGRLLPARAGAPSGRSVRNRRRGRSGLAPRRRTPTRRHRRRGCPGSSARRGNAAAPPRSNTSRPRSGPATCASAAGPRCTPSSPSSDTAPPHAPRFSLKITTECHSVFSLRSPVPLSFQVSDVAMRRFTTGSPFDSRRTSGSRPRLPTNITLFTLPAIAASPLHLS